MSESKIFTRDPSCGMTVDETTAVSGLRDGKTYYFCSDQCLRQFISVSDGEAKSCCA
jgi:Cu+-exporting ATPase